MAAGFAKLPTNDKDGQRRDLYVGWVSIPGTVGAATEGIVPLPYSGVDGLTEGNGWELIDVVLAAGTNITHNSSPVFNAEVEKNTDGSGSVLTTKPALIDTAGTGFQSTRASGTGVTQAVVKSDGSEDFADGDQAFVTVTMSGSGGAAPADASVMLIFARKQDTDPNF